MRREREHVKLHVTLINTRFRNNSGDYYGENDGDQISKTASTSLAVSKKGPSFDGRDMLRKYAAYDFGKQPVSEVHISRRFTTNCVGGFYDASAVAKVYWNESHDIQMCIWYLNKEKNTILYFSSHLSNTNIINNKGIRVYASNKNPKLNVKLLAIKGKEGYAQLIQWWLNTQSQ